MILALMCLIELGPPKHGLPSEWTGHDYESGAGHGGRSRREDQGPDELRSLHGLTPSAALKPGRGIPSGHGSALARVSVGTDAALPVEDPSDSVPDLGELLVGAPAVPGPGRALSQQVDELAEGVLQSVRRDCHVRRELEGDRAVGVPCPATRLNGRSS